MPRSCVARPAGSRRTPSRRAWRRPSSGIGPTKPGGAPSRAESTAASTMSGTAAGSGPRARAEEEVAGRRSAFQLRARRPDLRAQREEFPERAHNHARVAPGLRSDPSREVMHARLDDARPGALRLAEQLGVDEGAVGLEVEAGDEVAADQLEGAVEVPHAHAEDGADEDAAEEEGVQAPEPGVLPAQAITGDDVGPRRLRKERG